MPHFTQRYNVTKLVWYEPPSSVRSAIAREKQIKGWGRMKKVKFIEEQNPKWTDLARG
jgi:putative endonuclease